MTPLSRSSLGTLVFAAALCFLPARALLASGQAPSPSSDLDALQAQALQEAEAGKTDDAIRDYQRALSLRPGWKEGRWNLGTLQYQSNQFADAKGSFQKVVIFAPTLGDAWALLGLSEFETKDYADSLAHLEKSQSLGVNDDAEIDRVSKYHLALLLIRKGDFDHATEMLLKNFSSGQLSPQVKFALGLAALRVQLLPNEVDPSQEARILAAGADNVAGRNPASGPPIRAISSAAGAPASSTGDPQRWPQAMREYAAGQYQAAAADLKAALEGNPQNGTGWAMLGLSEFQIKDYDNALIHLQRGQQLGISGSPESLQSAKYTLGSLLVHAGEFDQAAEILSTATGPGPLQNKVEIALGLALLRKPQLPSEIDPSQTQLLTAAGKIAALLQNSQYDAAFQQFKPLLRQYPSTPFLHYAYGTALMALSEFDEAAAQMRAEMPISPASELPWVRLASISLRQHDPASAIPSAKRALELAPDSAEAHYLLGRASLESGDDGTALKELQIAAKLSPGSPEIHFNLAKAYARSKMPQDAERERNAFTQLNEIAEAQKSRHGSQIYGGPREAGEVTTPAQKPQASAQQN
jgi:tetratricopeptide (TPR) repeat protein